MQTKTTRAFRTISEAAEELDLQPHVLRFWESKFSQIRPIKRAGGRRLYRPEDIDLLRGIKILLHEEKHPIKDVQKIIRLKGPNQVVELGRSVKQAAKPRDVTDTVLIPERIKTKTKSEPVKPIVETRPAAENVTAIGDSSTVNVRPTASQPSPAPRPAPPISTPAPQATAQPIDTARLTAILSRLKGLREEWDNIASDTVK